MLKKHHKAARTVAALLLIFALTVIAEIFLFNLRHFTPALAGLEPMRYEASQLGRLRGFEYDEESCALTVIPVQQLEDQDITVEYSFSLGNLIKRVRTITLEIEPRKGYFDTRVSYSEMGYRQDRRDAGNFLMHSGVPRSLCMSVAPFKDAAELRFAFNKNNVNGLVVTGIVLNAPAPFVFSIGRVLLIFAVAALVYLIISFKLYTPVFDPHRLSHRFAFAATVLLCAGWALFTFFTTLPEDWRENGKRIDIEYNSEFIYYGPYHQMFDSFAKGMVNIDIPVDSRLAAVENPFDPSARDEAQAPYLWDRALYDHQYYSYFGVAPLLTVYIPYYMITSRVPTENTVTFILALFFVVGCVLLYRRVTAWLCPRAPLLLYLAGFVAVCLCSNVFWALRRPEFYEVAAIGGITYTVWMLYFAAAAALGGRDFQAVRLLMCGVFVALCAASRPNMLLYCAIAAVFILMLLLDRQSPLSGRIIKLGFFALPVAMGALALMYYNYLRFGSPFDFGAAYQLTVSDIRYNSASNLSGIIGALYHYLFQPTTLDTGFAFITASYYGSPLQYNYAFISLGMGLLYMPVNIFFPLSAVHGIKERSQPAKRAFLLLLAVLPLLIMYVNFTVAGVLYRYTLDFAMFTALAGVIALLRACTSFEGDGNARFVQTAALIVLVLSSTVALLLSISGEYNLFLSNQPRQFVQLKYLFEWWR